MNSAGLAPRLRRARWWVRRAAARLRYGGGKLHRAPLIFGNSFPKSGTHLLTQVLFALPQIGPAVNQGMGPVLTFERQTGRRRSVQEIVADLAPLRAGDIGFGHVAATPETQARLCGPRVAHFFLYRDPRDVAVSHAFYVTDRAPDHVHHNHYQETLGSPEERLATSIQGRPELGDQFPDIGARFALYRGWLDCQWVCRLRFEAFIEDRDAVLRKILHYLEARGFLTDWDEPRALRLLSGAIDPSRSPTFRQGRSGSWREHFTEEHRALFKEVAGDLLVELGYERGLDW